ncbi:PREDICTED: uncharacterized protein LOC105563522, partial [Vollenhovia emeryi]|uniref:uncharacterized protein LOC105563522 n=1 Tax=Vollenhovia emeryi TaxID=411798 RepID=UPI0005F54B96
MISCAVWVVTLNNRESARNVPKSSRICILHFTSECIERFGYNQLRLKLNSVPSIFPRAQEQTIEILPATPEIPLLNTDVIDNQCLTESEHIETVEVTTEISTKNQDLNPKRKEPANNLMPI